jgi:hypothetical protein
MKRKLTAKDKRYLERNKDIVEKIEYELAQMNRTDLEYVLDQLYIMNNVLDQIYFPEYHKVKTAN